ncbi:MAG: DoxX family protein [Pseudomonadota bacterium]
MSNTISKTALWTGRVLTGLVLLFLLMDITLKFMGVPEVAQAMTQLGWPEISAVPLAVLLLVCGLLYAVPKTSVLGAVLLTGYLGGAVATHVRINDPLFTHTLFGVYVGVVMWLGLWLRDARVRAVMPCKA